MRIPKVLRNVLIGYLLFHLVIAAIFLIVITRWQRDQLVRDTELRMQSMAIVLRENIAERGDLTIVDLQAHVASLGKSTNSRFTIIRRDGFVVADSEAGNREIGDHGDRPEVLLAIKRGMGVDQRLSATVDRQMMYLAIPYSQSKILAIDEAPNEADIEGFVRVAVDVERIQEDVAYLRNLVWSLAASLGLAAAVFTVYFISRQMKPLGEFAAAARKIADGQYEPIPEPSFQQNEWQTLADAFRHMQAELSRRESDMHESNRTLQAVLSGMIEGVFALDAAGTIMVGNDAGCEMLSLTHEDILGKRLLDFARIPIFQETVARALKEKLVTESEFETIIRPRRILSARATPLKGSPNPGVAIVLHDVTELRRLETMRSDFVTNVSHELKTPLASIKAYAETLKMGAVNDKSTNVQFVEQIEQQADRLNQQIKDLLELSRVEKGQGLCEFFDVSVEGSFAECVSRFKKKSEKREVLLEFTPLPESLFVFAEEEGVRTILDNLVSNALHYTRAGGKVILSAKQEGEFVVLSVTDTGIGIDVEHHERIFERFYRVDKARSRDFGGTGLGLAIVKHTAQALGGSVDLESQVGKGTTFKIRLPASKKPSAE